ncbi:MAG: transcription antitermination factor NusB [Thermodesulfobacteriota bacterium]
MAGRRRARIYALQFLFAGDLNAWSNFEEELETFRTRFELTPETVPHFFTLVRGVREKRQQIDTLLVEHSQNWKISRMSGVDRNIMKIAVYEMMYCEDVPFKVAINEAIEIGKQFSTEDSGAFINGVLDSIRKKIEPQTKKDQTPS